MSQCAHGHTRHFFPVDGERRVSLDAFVAVEPENPGRETTSSAPPVRCEIGLVHDKR